MTAIYKSEMVMLNSEVPEKGASISVTLYGNDLACINGGRIFGHYSAIVEAKVSGRPFTMSVVMHRMGEYEMRPWPFNSNPAGPVGEGHYNDALYSSLENGLQFSRAANGTADVSIAEGDAQLFREKIRDMIVSYFNNVMKDKMVLVK